MLRSLGVHRWLGAFLLTAGTVLVASAVAAGSGWIGGPWTAPGPTTAARPGLVYLNLTLRENPANGFDQVTPANFSLPAGVPVLLRITSYDPGLNPTSALWAQVMGATDGGEWIGEGNATPHGLVAGIDPWQVSHTITIAPLGWPYNGSMTNGTGMPRGMGPMPATGEARLDAIGGGNPPVGGSLSAAGMMGRMVNLPIPAAPSNTTPVVVSATIEIGAPGNYQWTCLSPCATIAMETIGYMRGLVSVT
jgi:hypothetical protein